MSKVIQIGNPILTKKAKKVLDISSKKIQEIIRELTKIMREGDLIGIAAPQIGISQRIFLTEIKETKFRKVSDSKNDSLQIFINPEIVGFSEELVEMCEGCGSVADSNFFVPVIRPMSVIIEAQNQKGQEFKLIANDLLARVIQHEYDHLDGIVFLQRNCDFSRAMSAVEYYKMMKNKQ